MKNKCVFCVDLLKDTYADIHTDIDRAIYKRTNKNGKKTKLIEAAYTQPFKVNSTWTIKSIR
jgi:hypothetical protein